MTQEQWEYGQGGPWEIEYESQMAFYEYLDELLSEKQYELHAIEIVLEMLNSQHFVKSGLSAKDYLQAERKILFSKRS